MELSSNKIKKARTRAGFATHESAAAALGWGREKYTKFEQADIIKYRTVFLNYTKAAEVFNCDLSEFFVFSGAEPIFKNSTPVEAAEIKKAYAIIQGVNDQLFKENNRLYKIIESLQKEITKLRDLPVQR